MSKYYDISKLKNNTINISFKGDDGKLWYSEEFCVFLLKEKDKEIERLNNIINDLKGDMYHELHGHILLHDEESWNPEYYTNGKLDYRKLLIGFLQGYLEKLGFKEENKK